MFAALLSHIIGRPLSFPFRPLETFVDPSPASTSLPFQIHTTTFSAPIPTNVTSKMSIEIIPLDHPGPLPSGIELVPPPPQNHGGHGGGGFRDDYHDDPPEHRPSMHQRMSSLSMHEIKPRPSSARRASSISKPRDKYVYYTLFKEGEDWSRVRRRKLSVPQDQLEKLAKKGKKKILDETKNMGSLRGQHFDMLIADLNKAEVGDATWDPVYITKERVQRKDRYEVKSMDIVFARTSNLITKSTSRKSVGGGGDIYDLNDKKSKDQFKDKEKSPKGDKKDKIDTFTDDDPFQTKPFFSKTGKPMDDFGAITFDNAGLPPHIPHDRAIGSKSDRERDKEKDKFDDHEDRRDRGGKRPQSRGGRGGGKKGRALVDDVIAGALGGGPGPLGGDSLNDILGDGGGRSKRNSRAGSRGAMDMPEISGRRSRSRRRPSQSRNGVSRSRSRMSRASHPEEVRFPPNWDRRENFDDYTDSSTSSTTSDTSKFGLGDYHDGGSSYTSQDTYHSLTGRGSQYYHGDEGQYHSNSRPHREKREKVWKEHSRGPPLQRSSTYEPYRSTGSRRYSMNRGGYYHDPIPESRQIGYEPHRDAPGPLVRRSTYDDGRKPILHYPSERDGMVDLKARDRMSMADGYMNQNIRDENLDRRERDVGMRERELDRKQWEEEEWKRQREREIREEEDRRRRDDDRRYYDADNRGGRFGGRDRYGDYDGDRYRDL